MHGVLLVVYLFLQRRPGACVSQPAANPPPFYLGKKIASGTRCRRWWCCSARTLDVGGQVKTPDRDCAVPRAGWHGVCLCVSGARFRRETRRAGAHGTLGLTCRVPAAVPSSLIRGLYLISSHHINAGVCLWVSCARWRPVRSVAAPPGRPVQCMCTRAADLGRAPARAAGVVHVFLSDLSHGPHCRLASSRLLRTGRGATIRPAWHLSTHAWQPPRACVLLDETHVYLPLRLPAPRTGS